MPLTKDFRQTLRERVQRDPDFRRALLQEAIEQMLSGDVATGKALVRSVRTPSPSLKRMFSPKGNPSASNVFGVIAVLQRQTCINFALKAKRRA